MKSTDILVIEPSKDLAAVLEKTFKRKGYKTKLAHTSQEGIEAADEASPRLVIIELLMPHHNGLEFIYEFRSYAEWMEIPIIIYSQLAPSALGADERILADMGIAKHFYKSTTSLEELVGAVESTFASVNL